MIRHTDLGGTSADRTRSLSSFIRKGEITLGGYIKAKIYGRLNCVTGKRMKVEHRVFFRDETDAVSHGYRPCGHCLREKYKEWKTKAAGSGAHLK